MLTLGVGFNSYMIAMVFADTRENVDEVISPRFLCLSGDNKLILTTIITTMKRSILFFISIFVLLSYMMAEPVDSTRALQVAKQFIPQNSSSAKKVPKKGKATEAANIVYTHKMPKRGRDAFYIVNVDDAFVLVSADDIAHQILGYSFDKGFPVNADGTVQLPPHIKGFFDDLAAQIEAAIEAEPNRAPSEEWSGKRKIRRAPSNLPESVGPLLTTTWDQGQYYNALCPEDVNGPAGHVWTGCVATAMAQIIKYWSEPVHGRGVHSYESNYGILEVNFAESNYDFSNMPDALSGESTAEQVNAVAKLMYDCGVAVNMGYAASESAAFDQETRTGLINFFRFSPDLSFAEKAYFSNEEWDNLLRQNLAANHPVYYSGQGTGGHAFVCDGYKADDYYHFNFGWGGIADGWFLTSSVTPNDREYNSSQSAIVGIVPDNTGNVILGQMQGTSTFVVDEPLEFYHLMGHNKYEGSNYSNSCYNTVSFIPADDSKQMVADIMEFEDQNVQFFDGTDTNNSLRSLNGGGNIDMSPIVSSANAITLTYWGNMYYAGFKLTISQDNGSRMVSNITSNVEATTAHLTWTENGGASQWQIEYGIKGFELGNGIVYNTDINTATFENLDKFTEFDFYIRSAYGNNQYGPWNKVTLMIEAPYWQDIVTSQPEGYIYDSSNNTVEISTAEGLAWWARNDCPYHAYLMADIDLSDYKWRPTNSWRSLYGQGHVISNAYIKEHTDDVGLFTDYGKDGTIADVGLENFNVIGRGNRTGGLCGTLRGTIRNCYINNSVIDGDDYTGGLIGENNYGNVFNSYVNANVTGNRWTGLMIGNSWEGTNRNCYAAGIVRHRSYCYIGGIAAYAGAGEITNCYSVETEMGVVGHKGSTHIADTSTFIKSDVDCTLLTPVVFDGQPETTLISALNRWVELNNDSVYCTWCIDTSKVNGGFPIFGSKYVVQCPNVTEVSIQNVETNGNNAVVISWFEEGNATQWQIRYRQHDLPDSDYTYILTSNNPTTIQGIPLGYVYDFNVRAIDNSENKSGWSETETLIVDLLYWTDIVTTQPEGFVICDDGNVEISSAEGLAWLAVMVNGLNGQNYNTFNGKTVKLVSDINIEGYRWNPIGGFINSDWRGFTGTFDGQGHNISNIYVNDAWSNLGMFGFVNMGIVKNVNIQGGSIASIYTDSRDSQSLHSSAIGGLIGYAADCYEITNCHSSANVYANGGAGSLCGYVMTNGGFGERINGITKISNCSASGIVNGRESCGGLIGDVYGDVEVRNCFATGDVNIAKGSETSLYRGGLIGHFMYAQAYNCYSIGVVTNATNNSGYSGKVIGSPYLNTHIHNIYGQDNINEGWELIGNYCEDIADTTQFHHEGALNTLIKPITVNGEDCSDLLDVLNAWVKSQNDQNLKTWVLDNNTEYPVFGDNYEPSCYNPTDLTVSQATIVGDITIRTKLTWNQIGEPDYWEVLYVAAEHDLVEGVIVKVNSNPFVLTDIPFGKPLDFCIRAVNNDDDKSNWSSRVTYIPDKLRWTEVVTTQPEGYQVDADGNVLISSAEGLAWLASVVNGLNDEQYNSERFKGKRIELISDINISAYRWTPIGKDWNYSLNGAIFDGNNNSISGLYCNELEDYQGLFGYYWSGSVSNVILNNCNVLGENYSGSIAGYALGINLVNCATIGNICGIEQVGGLVGRHSGGYIVNSFFVGDVVARRDITKSNTNAGYVGGICGVPFGDTVANCYVVSDITEDGVWSGIITGAGGRPDIVSNCYYNKYETTLPITSDNCTISNNSSFFGNETSWTLNTPPYIGDSFYTDLVDALNAWVDANNSEDQYRHWVADAENVNGGFPIFAPLYTLTYKVDGEKYKTDCLEAGVALPAVAEPTKDGYVFGGWNELPETMPDHDVEVTGTFYLYGDVNTDTKVNVVDVVDIARYVVDTPSENFREKLADLNKDFAVNIADAVVLVNHIAGEQNFVKAELPINSLNDYESCSLGLQYGEMNDLSFCLTGGTDFTAFQFEIDVPEGMNISAMQINSLRKDGHQLLLKRVADNRYRVAALSLSNTTFKGNDGELLNISLEGTGSDDICIHDIHFITTKGTDIVFDSLRINGAETGIADIHHEGNRPVYDLQGRRRSTLQRGVNIVGGKKMIVR